MKRKPTSNELLYAHVTRVGFDLTLGRSHIAALVFADLSMDRHQRPPPFGHPLRHAYSNFASGMGGLIARGLVVHHFNEKAQRESIQQGYSGGLKPHYTITTAGQLVIGLLKESGLYDEYAAALPVIRKAW